ncbi:MAG: ATP-dependent helicase [Planctomycetota bacterium]
MPLTANQARIVTAPTDRCVLRERGPGSGKTHVLVERYLHLITAGGFEIPDVLVATFTRQGRPRAQGAPGPAPARGRAPRELAGAGVGGHELPRAVLPPAPGQRAGRRVRALEPSAGRGRGQWTWPRSSGASSWRGLTDEALAGRGRRGPDPLGVIERPGATLSPRGGGSSAARGRTCSARRRSWLPGDGAPASPTSSARRRWRTSSPRTASSRAACLEIEARYEARKADEALLDHVDLQTRAVEFLRSEAGARVRGQFKVLLVDEFQDTNRVQLELLRLLARPAFGNLMAVGDERQSIYAFRGARAEHSRAA